METWGSRRWRPPGDDDVGVGHEVQAPTGAHAVDGGDHRLADAVLPGGQAQLGVLRPPRLLPEASRSRLSWATSSPVWNAGPAPVLTMTRTSGSWSSGPPLQLGEHGSVHGVADVGPVEDSQPTGPRRSTHCAGAVVAHLSCGDVTPGSVAPRVGLAGNTRSATTFLFTSVVPPSMVLARLRSMPFTS